MIAERRKGARTKVDRGTLTSARKKARRAGTASAPIRQANAMRFRSGKLAERQLPRYRPSDQNINACRGTAAVTAAASAGRNSSGVSRLKRSQNASTQQTAEASTSWAKASAARLPGLSGFNGFALAAPARVVHPQRQRCMECDQPDEGAQLQGNRLA